MKKPMKSHKEPDKDDRPGYRGRGDRDADDKRRPAPALKGVKKGK